MLQETWESQGNAIYSKIWIALHLRNNPKPQFFQSILFSIYVACEKHEALPINSLHLCPWSDMLTKEHDISSNSNKNLWFLKRIYLINYSIITVESKTMSLGCTSQNFGGPLFCNSINRILSPRLMLTHSLILPLQFSILQLKRKQVQLLML